MEIVESMATRYTLRNKRSKGRKTQAATFCSCIKKVQKTLKTKEEGRAIAICVRSVLQTKGRTLKTFRCRRGKPTLTTQAPK